MPDIRYVCISDMHLGEEDSVLTCLRDGTWEVDWREPSPTLRQLVECVKSLIDKNETGTKPTLIMMGDILEFALATDNQAAMGFERFIELIMPESGGLFDRIFYVPGNHDHHLWESARETQYVEHLQTMPPGTELDPHGTRPVCSLKTTPLSQTIFLHASFSATPISRILSLAPRILISASSPRITGNA
jgi:metallophosphoesterase superfamily enzyme